MLTTREAQIAGIFAVILIGATVQSCLGHCAEVTPELVCTVQSAIRWDLPRWSPQRCAAVAVATNEDPAPDELLAVMVLESGMRAASHARHAGGRILDVGLGGVRCVLDRGRCANWPVRGITPARLMDPVVNIRAASKVLAWKRRTCGERAHDCYVGNRSGSKGRRGHVLAIVAAFSGEVVPLKARRDRRAAALARKIAKAVAQATGVKS